MASPLPPDAPLWAHRLAEWVDQQLQQLRSRTNRGTYSVRNTIARTDTSAKNLFRLPAYARPIRLSIFGTAASDAGTTATISVGKTGANTHFLNGHDVKTSSSGAGQVHPNGATNLDAVVGTSDIQVTGIYAETGSASTAGGPWTVVIDFVMG